MKTEQEQAEREMLGSQIKVLKQRLNNKYVEIEKLKAENCELTKKLEARLTCDFVRTAQKQAQIDVLNRVMTYINNKIENDYGDMSDSVQYLTINIDDFDDFIDELIKEVQNGEDKS